MHPTHHSSMVTAPPLGQRSTRRYTRKKTKNHRDMTGTTSNFAIGSHDPIPYQSRRYVASRLQTAECTLSSAAGRSRIRASRILSTFPRLPIPNGSWTAADGYRQIRQLYKPAARPGLACPVSSGTTSFASQTPILSASANLQEYQSAFDCIQLPSARDQSG